MQKRFGFTLAEVLITLGIIGVVASITIPTLIQNSREQQTASALKKAYSTLSNAYTLAAQENGTPDYWGLTVDAAGSTNIMNKFAKYLVINKNCGNTDFSCFPDVYYKYLNGQDKPYKEATTDYARAQLKDGMIIQVQVFRPACDWNLGDGYYSNVCGSIAVDINGFKKPNQHGVDYFLFFITKNGIVPAGASADAGFATFSNFCRDKSVGLITGQGPNGVGCTAWVIYNENMDYLHCSDLSWTGKHKCS